MTYGMTYDEFWDGEPKRAQAYWKAHRLRIQQENEMAWWQGMYNLKAFSVPLSHMFSKHGDEYFKEPVRLFPLTKEEQEEQNEYVRNKTVGAIEMVFANFRAREKK